MITKSDIEALMDELAKEVPCDCPADIICDCYFSGKLQVRIGDVIKAMRMRSYDLPGDRKDYALKILDLFQRCGGEDLSLQQIFSEWEEVECIDPDCKCETFPLRNDKCPYKSRLRSKEAQALGEYLLTIFKK